MKIGWSSGYLETYWGDWLTSPQVGGSERIVIETACAMANLGHEVTVRLPYSADEFVYRGVRWIGLNHASESYDLLLCADDHAKRDHGGREILVVNRSDPPPTTDFDALVFLSAHHARLLGHAGHPFVGGGVDLSDYVDAGLVRVPRRVICTSSPDRCPRAATIGRSFDFKHAYKPVPGYETVMYEREDFIALQQTAQVLIYPLEPSRPSDFFSMAVLESMAAGTPVVVSDADSMPELWSDSAIILPNPVRLSQWYEQVNELLENRTLWERQSQIGRQRALDFTWDKQALKYLAIAEA